MSEQFRYGMKRTLPITVEEADARVREELKKAGFGVLTEIDVQSTLQAKLGVRFRPYRILGACNPPLAHRALEEELDIGLLLPCNWVVYQGEGPGESIVAVLDPQLQLSMAGRADLEPLASEVKSRLEGVLESIY